MYSCHLFLACSASVRSLPFLSLEKRIAAKKAKMNAEKKKAKMTEMEAQENTVEEDDADISCIKD